MTPRTHQLDPVMVVTTEVIGRQPVIHGLSPGEIPLRNGGRVPAYHHLNGYGSPMQRRVARHRALLPQVQPAAVPEAGRPKARCRLPLYPLRQNRHNVRLLQSYGRPMSSPELVGQAIRSRQPHRQWLCQPWQEQGQPRQQPLALRLRGLPDSLDPRRKQHLPEQFFMDRLCRRFSDR